MSELEDRTETPDVEQAGNSWVCGKPCFTWAGMGDVVCEEIWMMVFVSMTVFLGGMWCLMPGWSVQSLRAVGDCNRELVFLVSLRVETTAWRG